MCEVGPKKDEAAKPHSKLYADELECMMCNNYVHSIQGYKNSRCELVEYVCLACGPLCAWKSSLDEEHEIFYIGTREDFDMWFEMDMPDQFFIDMAEEIEESEEDQ